MISGTGGSFTKIGTGTQTLSGGNTYTGGTTVSAGTLKLSGSGTLGSTSGSLTVSNSANLDLNGTNQTVGALNGASSSAIIKNTNSSTPSTLTVGGGNATGSFAGQVAVNVGTTLNLTKTGSGTQSLTGNNSFSGATVINDGTLRLANSGTRTQRNREHHGEQRRHFVDGGS